MCLTARSDTALCREVLVELSSNLMDTESVRIGTKKLRECKRLAERKNNENRKFLIIRHGDRVIVSMLCI